MITPKRGSSESIHELDRASVRLTMAGVIIAMFMASLDQTIVATALPTIAKELHGFASYSGVITAYLIASTVTLPIAGKLCDTYGRKRFLIFGIAWFIIASILCGMAQSMAWLIAFRAIKGIGAGVMQSAATTTIADLYPPAKRGQAIAILSTMGVLSSIVGPLAGGFLTDGPGWRYVFFINVPIGLIGLFVVQQYFPRLKHTIAADFKIDFRGVLTLIAGVVPLLLALHNIGEKLPWNSLEVSGLGSLGVFFCVLFLFVERKAAHPIVPLPIFKNSIISLALLSAGLIHAAMFGVTLFVPLFLQSVLRSSAQASGEILLPLSITFAVVATITGHLIGRMNRYRNLALFGTMIAALGAFLLAQMNAETTHLTLISYVVFTAFGIAMAAPVYNIAVQNAADLKVISVATSMVYFSRSISSSIGVAVFGTILATQTKTLGLSIALNHVFYLVSALLVATFIATLFLKEIPLRRSNAPKN